MITASLESVMAFVAAVGAFAVVGLGIGMLVARRLDRWAEAAANDGPSDTPEEPGDDARPHD